MPSARSNAMARIAQAARRFPQLMPIAVRTDHDDHALDPRDAALAMAIEHHVQRRWLTLVAVLETQLSRPWSELEHRLQAALLCGAAQLLLMDRLPDYAIIDETVEWAKSTVRPKAGGLINAVLRRIAALRVGEATPGLGRTSWARNELPLSDGRIRILNQIVFAEADLARLAQQTSHSPELLEHWVSLFGTDRAAELATHSLVMAPIILHGVDDDIASTAGLLKHEAPGFWIMPAPDHFALERVLHDCPRALVQDPTSAEIVDATKSIVLAPSLVIDLCAGRGTKTRQLSSAYPKARIIATDIDAHRQRALRESLHSCSNVDVIEFSALVDFAGLAEVVLLDVPCSNTGVLARRVEAKHRFTLESLRSLTDAQKQIVADALRLLSDDGMIAYATCSIDPAENESQTKWITQWHPYHLVAQKSTFPIGLPGDSSAAYRDGGYWALLKKQPVKR